MIVLFRYSIKYTKNTSIRLIVITLAALWSLLFIIFFGPHGAWKAEGVIIAYFLSIFIVHFFCLLTVLMFYLFDKFRPINQQENGETEQDS